MIYPIADKMIVPQDMQVCIVTMKGNTTPEFAIWTTNYSMYGAGGHFQFADGSMAGIPIDVQEWFGTHWIAKEKEHTAINGQTGRVA